jgi:hypothetical protein
MRFALLFLLALALLTPACTGESDAETSLEQLTPAELGWIRVYAAWTIDIYDGELGPPGGPPLVKKCRERREELGDPPTERLQAAAERAAAACPLLAHRGMHRRALDVVDEADELLRPLLLEVQPLPLEAGETTESRADLDMSSWVTHELGRPAEVRCWDDEDWPRVIGEDDAWTDDHTDVDELYGWSEEWSDRIHMSLDQCNRIARFRAREAGGGSRSQEIETANALGTLFHEATHLMDPDLDEAEVECEVLYWFDLYAEGLGGDIDVSERLARLYRTEVYPEQPDEYVSDCDE